MSNPQKIFDILPPDKVVKVAPPERRQKKSEKEPKDLKSSKIQKDKFGFNPRVFLVFLAFLVIAFILVSQFVLNKTEIKVYPKNEIVSLSGDVNVNAAKSAIDIAGKIIPGKIFTAEKTVSEDFPATGKATQAGNASGTIRIYNSYSISPQILVKNTRLISSEGKLFRTADRVVIPGAVPVREKLQASFLDVKVVADQPGQDYNIEPSTFSIPGFVGTPKYTAFYGKSSLAMAGGYLGQAKQVTKADLDAAKSDLSNKAQIQGKESLLREIPADFVVLEDAIFSVVVSSSSSLPAGSIADNFTYRVTAKLQIIAFKKSDLENFSKMAILAAADEGKKIQDSSLNLSYDVKSFDATGGKMTVTFSSSAKIYSDVKVVTLSEALRGQSLSGAQDILSQNPEIVKAQIKSWPFWMDSIPKEADKVRVTLMLD